MFKALATAIEGEIDEIGFLLLMLTFKEMCLEMNCVINFMALRRLRETFPQRAK